MRQSKPSIPRFSDGPKDEQREARQLALEYIAEAWNAAEDDGIAALALAHASLFAAITTLVREHGDDAAAVLMASLPDRIRSGEYNLDRMMH